MIRPCKLCGEPVIELPTENGKSVVLDARPHKIYFIKDNKKAVPSPKDYFRVAHRFTCTKIPKKETANAGNQTV